ncbi:MAG: glycosyltransferase [Solobacterium sp.]|nr:glycosyltransferase [Solobacterium sp.]
MNIMIIIHSLRGGGAEKVAADLITRMSVKHRVCAVLIENNGDHDYPIPVHVPVYYLQRHEQVYRRGNGTRDYLSAYYRDMSDQVRMIKQREHIDCALSFLEQGNYLNILSKGKERVLISIRNHMSVKEMYRRNGDMFMNAGHMSYQRKADRIICVSEDVREDQYRNYHMPERKLSVIRNYIDSAEMQKKAQESLNDEAFTAFRESHGFLYVNSGRLTVQKGQKHILKAFTAVHEKYPDTGLVILGEGELRASLTKAAGLLGIENDVYFAGRQSDPYAYMKQCDVFVLASLYEGFSNVLLEANALSLPVIASDCTGVRELYDPKRPAGRITAVRETDYALLVPCMDIFGDTLTGMTEKEEYLYQAMIRMYEDEDLRRKYMKNSRILQEKYRPEVILPLWEAECEGRYVHG